MAATIEIDEANGAVRTTGTATSTSSGKLVDTGKNFTTLGVDVGDEVYNTTDSTHAYVTAVDSSTQLSLSSDIMASGEGYTLQAEMNHNITNSNMGSNDSVNLNPVTYPVTPGNNTYEKYQKMHVTAMGGSSAIQNLKVWRTGALGGAATHVTNARESSYVRKPYVAPVASASSVATQTMPTSEPSGSNLGINGSLSGQLTAAGYSDWLVHQIKTNVADTAGSTSTLNYQYDEVA